ncbi:tyrosine-type recombinase/integrase [Caenispirillum bisanense]|uniref:Phage integrase family protein n=1 Tax=Caenispirillum bisanense TaxID=414052 RepID=A0A286G3T8_9PROT|nr:integrase family protein [Caenispirillum bisanense]SOD90201.1 Phage integrase family protein [Caenispirillum bisanense]
MAAPKKLTDTRANSARGRAKASGAAVDMAAGLAVPGLQLRTTRTGQQAWTLRLRFGGKQLRLNLGIFPAVDREAARAKALGLIQAARDGNDPAAVLHPPAAPTTPAKATLREAWSLYAATRTAVRSAGQEQRRMELHVFPRLGDLAVEDAMTAAVLVPHLEALAHQPTTRPAKARGGRPQGAAGGLTAEANRVYTTLRAFAAWARRRRMIRENPFDADGIERPVKEEPSERRQREETERVLDLAELAALWRGLDDDPSPTLRALLRLLMLVPLRREEVTELSWAEYEPEGAAEDYRGPLLRIAADRMKGTRPAVVPLPARAAALVEERRDAAGLSPFVFPGRSAKAAFKGWRNGARRAIEALQRELPEAAPFTIRDIRRSVASALVRDLGADELLVKRILQHSTRAALGVTAVYQKSKRLREQAAVLQAWADLLVATAEGREAPGNVVQIKRPVGLPL